MGNKYEKSYECLSVLTERSFIFLYFIWIILVMYIFYIVYKLSIRNDGCSLYTFLSKGLNKLKFKLHFYFYFSKFYTLNTILKWAEFNFVLTICVGTHIFILYIPNFQWKFQRCNLQMTAVFPRTIVHSGTIYWNSQILT